MGCDKKLQNNNDVSNENKIMFQLKELQKFKDCKALIYYKDVNSFVNYSYKELIQEANKVLELLQDLSDKQVIGIFVQKVNNWLFPLIIG